MHDDLFAAHGNVAAAGFVCTTIDTRQHLWQQY